MDVFSLGYMHVFVDSNSQRIQALGQRMKIVEVSVNGGWFIQGHINQRDMHPAHLCW